MVDENQSMAPAHEEQRPSAAPGLTEAREGLPTGEHHIPSPQELKARGRRNITIALAVAGFVLLVYLTTFLRLAENLEAAGGGAL
ncbi:MAG: hypothetical protein AAF225_00980 [Pseudomonadota bacterium]